MGTIRDHAVVIGGSMSGLVTARVLAETYERVTIVDRDELPTKPQHRRRAGTRTGCCTAACSRSRSCFPG